MAKNMPLNLISNESLGKENAFRFLMGINEGGKIRQIGNYISQIR